MLIYNLLVAGVIFIILANSYKWAISHVSVQAILLSLSVWSQKDPQQASRNSRLNMSESPTITTEIHWAAMPINTLNLCV